MNGVDAIVHAAFASPRAAASVIKTVNEEGARQVCSQALKAGVPRVVLISSTIVERPARSKALLRAKSVAAMDLYRQTRAKAEKITEDYASRGLSVAIARPKTFIGPGRVSAFHIIFDWIRRGRPVILLGNGKIRYQLLEIGDMAEGIRLLTGSSAEGVFHFGAREFQTLHEDLQSVIDHARTGSRLCFVPASIARIALNGADLAGLVPTSELHVLSAWGKDSVAGIGRAEKELHWSPRWSNREALRRAYDWYVSSMEAAGSAPAIHALPRSHRALQKMIEALLK